MEFDVSKIKKSRNDIRQGIRIPTKMTPELAEFIGIMVGDGHIGEYGYHKQLVITGNANDRNYYEGHVNKIIQTLFNVKFTIYHQKTRNAIIVQKHSKALFQFFREVIGLPQRKDSITIPGCIAIGSEDVKIKFLRGLADADFCFTVKYRPKCYPVIHGTFKSQDLTLQCSKILNEMGIKNYVREERDYYKTRQKTYVRHRLYINGFSRVTAFLRKVGFSNLNKSLRITNMENGPDGI